jgi:uncharacterized protein YndB with AHSA1/START domain
MIPPQGPRTLQVTTPSAREVVLRRSFDAPRRLVFAALTTPALLVRWYGPPGWSLPVCEVDLRVGGAYRFVSRGPDGAAFEMRGRYREIAPPERLVHTERYTDLAAGAQAAELAADAEGTEGTGDAEDSGGTRDEALVTTVLTETGGATTLTSTVRYASPQHRDRVLRSGMERGAAQSYDRLAALLASLA